MSSAGRRALLGAIAAAGLLLSPLPAIADEAGPGDLADVWARAGSTDVLAVPVAEVPADQMTLVVGGCRTFDATNRFAEPVILMYGDFDEATEDWAVIVNPGATVRMATQRESIDYIAVALDSLLITGMDEGVPIDRVCAAAPPESANARYISSVYVDLFHRSPDTQGLTAWTAALDAGAPRIQVANAITYSREYRAQLISGVYWEFLGREADPNGLANWLLTMQAGVTISQMEAGFIASDEYYYQAGGTTAGWVKNLYWDVLGREASAAEVAAWVAARNSGASRQQIAMGFLLSTERLNFVVASHYQYLLGRGVDVAGQASWVRILQAGGRDEAIIGGIIASGEYYARH